MYLPDKNLMPPAQAESAPFTVQDLIAWLEKQDQDEVYNYYDCERCVLGQYGFFHGMRPADFSDDGSYYHAVQSRFPCSRITLINIVQDQPRTFGAALKRARKATV